MTLGEKQQKFSRLVVRLLHRAHRLGYEVRLGETHRPAEMSKLYAARGLGVHPSIHNYKLGIDLHLFRDGVYLRKAEDHQVLGEYWEKLHPLCRWGGRFKRKDGNHYSMEHAGLA